jgi:hypothetical protein
MAEGHAGGAGGGGGAGAGAGALGAEPLPLDPEPLPLDPEPLEEPPDDVPLAAPPDVVPLAELLEPGAECEEAAFDVPPGACAECSVSGASLSAASVLESVSDWPAAPSTIVMIEMLEASAKRRVSMPEITGELLAAPTWPPATLATSPLVPPKNGTITRRTVVSAVPAIAE